MSATRIISAFLRIYQRNSNYISVFLNISAQLELYQRFSEYISATRIISAILRIYRLIDKS
ncbi:hypothetical protein BLO02_005830 [Bacillus cereus]|nr:hypothetical protein BLO02_005830 [Bacillus cereus]